MERAPAGSVNYAKPGRIRHGPVSGKPIAVFDFDGTLAPIVKRPASARISRQTKKELAGLMLFSRVFILTGRPSSFVKAQLRPLRGVKAIGLHGNEGAKKGAALRELELLARGIAEAEKGIHVEPKPSGFAVHYRNGGKTDAQARKLLSPLLMKARGRAKVVWGRKACEFLPKGAKTKRETLLGLALRNSQSRVVFVGDDYSDCEAMLACSRLRNFTGALVRSSETHCRGLRQVQRRDIFRFVKRALLDG